MVNAVCCVPAEINAPINVIPDMALDPDMSGVCKVGGTLVMTSKPTNIASTNIVKTKPNDSISLRSFPLPIWIRAPGLHGPSD